MKHDYDVVVLGGGPAGSLAAALLRRQDPDRRVLVLEKESFPRHHVGESCIPGWRPILERAGVLEVLEASDVMRKVGTVFQWGRAHDQAWTVDFRDQRTRGASVASYQVDRARFDLLLLDHARSLGATVHQLARAKAVEPISPRGFAVRWEDEGSERVATTTFVVDASGQARLLARLFDLRVEPFDDMNNFAVYGYWRGSRIARFAGPPVHERERWTAISASPDGWTWHIPTTPDLVSVGLVTDAASIPSGGAPALEDFYLRNVRQAEHVRDLLRDAELTQHPLASGRLLTVRDWAYRVDPACGPGWFLAGDAAAFVDPILSTGLSIAAHGASLVANALHTIWTDPSLDEALLQRAYTAAYADMALSYHRLARIWYARNFTHDTWHWEAMHQRLRVGRHPASETSAEAFLRLCLGAFANPIEGVFGDVGFGPRRSEANVRMMRSHLYPDAAPDEGRFDPADARAAARGIRERSRTRWRELLGSIVALRGCAARLSEGYFTDRNRDRWERVCYCEIAPEGNADPFERVVFPEHNILDHLRAGGPLREAVRAFRGGGEPESAADQQRLQLAEQQVLQLDLRGWLDVRCPPSAAAASPEWPRPLRVLAEREPIAVAVDLAGDTLLMRSAHLDATLMPAGAAPRGRVYMSTASTAFSYRGNLDATRRAVERLMAEFDRWEREDPAAAAWWTDAAPKLAGEVRVLQHGGPAAATELDPAGRALSARAARESAIFRVLTQGIQVEAHTSPPPSRS
jgi:flavin-dependent dehydrogenase